MLLRLLPSSRRTLCTPMYASVEELVKAQISRRSLRKNKSLGIYHPRLETTMVYFRKNEDRYSFIQTPPPDKHVLGLLRRSDNIESILDNVSSPEQSLKMFQILATFSDSIPLDSPVLEKCISILLNQEYSRSQLLESVTSLSKVNAERLIQCKSFLNLANKLMDKSRMTLNSHSDRDLTKDASLRSYFFRLAYFWMRYNYSLNPFNVTQCAYTASLLKKVLYHPNLITSLSKEEGVFTAFLIGNLRTPPASPNNLIKQFTHMVQKMDLDEISIIASSFYLSKVNIHSHDRLVNSLLSKVLNIPPSDVSVLERVLSPLSKSLKKATLIHIEKKKHIATRFGPILQYLSFNTRIHFLKFLSVNGCQDIKGPLQNLVLSFNTSGTEVPRMKDWESIVQSLVLLNYHDDDFYERVAGDVIDSCLRQNHHQSIKSLINLILYLTHRGIYKKSSIDKIFQLVNRVDSKDPPLLGLVKALYSESGASITFIDTEISKSKYSYVNLIRNILQLDCAVRTFIPENDISSRLREDLRVAFSSFILFTDDLQSDTTSSNIKSNIVNTLQLEPPHFLSTKISPYLRSKDIIVKFNYSSQSFEKMPQNLNVASPTEAYTVLLVPKRILLLHNKVENGYLNFQIDLFKQMGYTVVVMKGNTFVAQRASLINEISRGMKSSRARQYYYKIV